MTLTIGITKTAARVATLVVASVTIAAMQSPVHGEDTPSGAAAPATPAPRISPYSAVSEAASADAYYQSVWGIGNLLVRQTASGSLIRFSYRITDPIRAKALGDKEATPFMISQRNHAVLQIPVMEKVGQLRQTGALQAGKEYWMVFSNKGNFVRPGDRVNVVVGSFHVDGLIVE